MGMHVADAHLSPVVSVMRVFDKKVVALAGDSIEDRFDRCGDVDRRPVAVAEVRAHRAQAADLVIFRFDPDLDPVLFIDPDIEPSLIVPALCFKGTASGERELILHSGKKRMSINRSSHSESAEKSVDGCCHRGEPF